MPSKVIVVATDSFPAGEVERVVREHAGEDAEVHVVAPASKISWLDWLTNAEDDARAEAAERADEVAEAVPSDEAEPHVGDVDPLQAVIDALRMFPADELIVLVAPGEQNRATERLRARLEKEGLALPVTYLTVAPARQH
jgi:hypothetical protein